MPKKITTDQQCELLEELTDWLISRCPAHLSARSFNKLCRGFIKGQLIVVKGPINPETDLDIRVE